MKYDFLYNSIDKENLILPNSDKINSFLLKNNEHAIVKALDFFASDEKCLHVHGFMGTGKRQFINYITDFLAQDVIKLEYYCKASTVCDDILLSFIEKINDMSISKAINTNVKISTTQIRFTQQIESIRKPFIIILHSFDDIEEQNAGVIAEYLSKISTNDNLKIIISTRAMQPTILDNLKDDRKVFLKAFTQEIFKEFVLAYKSDESDKSLEDFYKYTRGYYYYTALAIKIMQAMKIDIATFLQKFLHSGLNFDAYLGVTYVNLVPTTIRNFFWFLRTIRHGLTLNALAVFEIYDEFSIEFLKTNLMIFQNEETIYVQDFFLQKIDISIPDKIEIRLHKYIIGIYEKQLKANLKDRVLKVSRQTMRAEIEYHNTCILNIENPQKIESNQFDENLENNMQSTDKTTAPSVLSLKDIRTLMKDKKYTDVIENCKKLLDTEEIDLQTVTDTRLLLVKAYKAIDDYKNALHYSELVEAYYLQHNELINLNYLYYDMTDLYFKTYKHERAIKTIKHVIYSVDTPQSLFVSACTLLGNIYFETNDNDEAYNYFKKAIESLNDNTENSVLAELYFKYALVCDDKNNVDLAFEYYNKCINIKGENPYKASAYSNLASCYLDNNNLDDAKYCFKQAYKTEKDNNNYDGIYYNASFIAKILIKENDNKALNYLLEAQKSAEFVNEDFYILNSTVALGDYYYDIPSKSKEALTEYFKAYRIADRMNTESTQKIEQRINDMRYRMKEEDFKEIENKYARKN